MNMQIEFPGGVAVTGTFKEFTVKTDQPIVNGGTNQNPSPFDLFLVSLGTCAGFYALRFCQQRNLATEGMRLSLDTQTNPETKRLEKVLIVVTLPEEFPEKYRDAILRATDQCAVKQALVQPPEVAVSVV